MSALADLRQRFGGGSGPSGNVLWGGLGALFLFFVLGAEAWGWQLSSEAKELEAATNEVRDARPKVQKDKEIRERAQRRYASKAPELATFLEEKAKSSSVSLADTQPQAEVPSEGKQFVERGVVTHLRRVGLKPLVSFMEALESAHLPLAVTRVNVRKRSTEPNSYDVELGVSAYDRKETEKKKAEAKP